MKKLILLLLAIAATLILAQAQSGELKGTVKDGTDQPIPFANIAVYKGPQLVTAGVANIDGEYSIKPITHGIYDVEMSSVGFSKSRYTQVVIDSGKITFLNGTLTVSHNLGTVTIQCAKPIIEKDQGVQGQSWERREILKNPSRDISGPKHRGNTTLRGSRGSTEVLGVSTGHVGKGNAPNKPQRNHRVLTGDDEFARLKENGFQSTRREPLSTFSVDVDKASYTIVQKIIREGQLPPVDAVRTEELINYFDYNYPGPEDEHPFRIITELTECPWNKDSRILKLALQGKRLSETELPPSSFTFLVDVSGSMQAPNKLPLVQASLLKLLDKMRPQDQVGIVVYAGAAGVVLETQPIGDKAKIVDRIMAMQAGGSTAGGAGIQKAYALAEQHFIKGGNNRIILCTDGDFNVGVSSESDLTTLIENERQKGIYLTVLGYGMGNYKDSKLELLANKGNGNYAYIDDYSEAEKFLGKEFAGSMYTIAKDVKIQIEFNPAHVKSYRLIGYENRMLAAEDFNDDKKDAGEIGSGHTVTALYEIRADDITNDKVDSLKYQRNAQPINSNLPELATVKFRYKKPDGDQSILMTKTVGNETQTFAKADESTRFAVSVAAFGQLLRKSAFVKNLSLADVADMAAATEAAPKDQLRKEFIQLVKDCKKLGDLAKN